MENSLSSPTRSRTPSPRPAPDRKRSNSFPMVDALGCSTPEAELLLAEGRVAVQSRRRRRRMKQAADTYRPQDHLKYLNGGNKVVELDNRKTSVPRIDAPRHFRMPSNATDSSTSTIVEPVRGPVVEDPLIGTALGSPLEDYSANLAKFIKSQLSSIPSYQPCHSSISPISCPDLSFQIRTPPQSPTKTIRRPADVPKSIEIPPIRPPMKSSFSAWSSTDDEAEADDELPSLPPSDLSRTTTETNGYTPSVLGYYENTNNSSFLFSTTPTEEEEDPDTAKGISFPNRSELPGASTESPSTSEHDYPSSALSTHPQLTSSSAPSISSSSNNSYFECKRPVSITVDADLRDRVIAAVTPQHNQAKIITAISPFEGGALATVHDVFVESQHRVRVDGMTFDMVRDFAVPDERIHHVPTPC